MSKQEARLPDDVEFWVEEAFSRLEAGKNAAIIDGLRSAILAALDEARDEVLEEAAELVEHPQTSYRRIELADKIRVLKSKRGA